MKLSIPIGKQNKETRNVLMNKANLTPRQFRKELARLREKYIIINDNGYYLPASKEEYEEFIQKQNERYNITVNNISEKFSVNKNIVEKATYINSVNEKTIDLAYKEMKDKC